MFFSRRLSWLQQSSGLIPHTACISMSIGSYSPREHWQRLQAANRFSTRPISRGDFSHLGSPGDGIGPAQRYKLRMGSGFHNAAFIEDVNDVGVHGGGEAVRDHEPRPSLGESTKTAQPILLRPGIHDAGGFVKDDQRGLPKEGSGQGDPLP